MIKSILCSICVLLLVGCYTTNKVESVKLEHQDGENPYQADWSSVKKHQTPDWFLNAKFGIYFHWGPYTVPAHKTEWYSIWMYQEGHPIRKHHEQTYGPLDEFGYKDFIPMFTADKFDPQEWAALFKQAGAQFAGPVTEHADGFAMWDSELTKWNAADMGPKRDIVGEMAKAIREQDMKFIATFHHQWKYAWYPTWDENTDASNPEYADLYGPKVPKGTFDFKNMTHADPLPDQKFNQEWLAKILEVVDKYSPDLVYFDNKMNIIEEQTRLDFLSYYYNHAAKREQDVVVTYKFEDLEQGSAVLDLERSRMSEKKSFPWLTDDSIDWNSWTHIANPNYKTANRLIDFLVDVVSKNGGVLLNITPTAQGEIPQAVRDRLLAMGDWLKTNGESIYDTRPWDIYGEGPAEVIEGHLSEHKNKDNTEKDIRFTTNGDALYATVLDWPTEQIHIRAFNTDKLTIKAISLLGSSEVIQWQQLADGLFIQAPKVKVGQHAFVFKVTTH
ncbi:alpha-L-fucosidase [Paraglaciecola sp.]|uniref:alpha-L-fucosidase n=1 Tax=Paraglaciecola sp. TaxID=1920173 RepID=UPI003EF87E70